jgi:hypothetical protein
MLLRQTLRVRCYATAAIASASSKIVASAEEAVRDIKDGSTLLVGGEAAHGTADNWLVALFCLRFWNKAQSRCCNNAERIRIAGFGLCGIPENLIKVWISAALPRPAPPSAPSC